VPSDLINAGTVIILNNDVNTVNLLAIDFDGRDKFAATKTIAVTRTGWADGSDTLLAGSVGGTNRSSPQKQCVRSQGMGALASS